MVQQGMYDALGFRNDLGALLGDSMAGVHGACRAEPGFRHRTITGTIGWGRIYSMGFGLADWGGRPGPGGVQGEQGQLWRLWFDDE